MKEIGKNSLILEIMTSVLPVLRKRKRVRKEIKK